jgi:hypothetical protein
MPLAARQQRNPPAALRWLSSVAARRGSCLAPENWLKPMTVLQAATEAHGRNNAMPLLRADARRTLCPNRVRGRYFSSGENRGSGDSVVACVGQSERWFLLVFDAAAEARRHVQWGVCVGPNVRVNRPAEAGTVRPG